MFILLDTETHKKTDKKLIVKNYAGAFTIQTDTDIDSHWVLCLFITIVPVSVSGSVNSPLTGDGSNGNAKIFERTALSNTKCFLKGHSVEFLIV